MAPDPSHPPHTPDPRDHLDLSTRPPKAADAAASDAAAGSSRKKFLSLYFACAHAYGRAHRTADGSCYRGRCPKCGKSIEFPIGQGGTSRRMFEVRCGG